MSVAPLFPEKPVKIVVPTGVSWREIWQWKESQLNSSDRPLRVKNLLTAENSCIQLLVLPLQPIRIQKRKKKSKGENVAVSSWRLTCSADRITKSKYENHCCSPEPSAKSTGPGSGQESLLRGDVDSNGEWLTILLGQLHMAVITHCDRNFQHAMYKRCEKRRIKSWLTWTQ